MKNKVLFIVMVSIIVLIAVQKMSKRGNEMTVTPSAVDTAAAVWEEPELVNSIVQSVSSEFKFDGSRLYDISYETDAELIAFAKSIGKSPACVIELVKRQIDDASFSSNSCVDDGSAKFDAMVVVPGVYETACRMQGIQEYCRRVKVADHPYEKYSDDELRSLAVSSPEAAVILARRVPDDALSERYYEKAVALSGRPGPLEEWMLHRNLGGLVHIDGVLDVDKAILGYEVYLTTNQLGYGASALAEYERVLLNANVNLAPIRERARTRFARLTDARLAIVGSSWEG